MAAKIKFLTNFCLGVELVRDAVLFFWKVILVVGDVVWRHNCLKSKYHMALT